MMAWLTSPQMARHATRLGEQLRFNTIFPPKLSEIAILVTAAALDRALRMVGPQAARLEGRHGPANHRRHPRPPHAALRRSKGQMIYDVAKSLHEGHGLSKDAL